MRRVMLAAAAALLYASATPASAAARDTLPPEPPATVLRGTAAQAIAVDLDADGGREVVRLVTLPEVGGMVDVHERQGGEWRPVRAFAIPGGRLRLLAWRDGERDRVAVVSSTEGSPVPCCTSISGVELDDAALDVRPLWEDLEPVQAVLAVDLDGDETDELILTSPGRVSAVRWSGERFEEIDAIDIFRGSDQTPMAIGDSNGDPGDEAVLVEGGGAGTSAGGFLVRVSLGPDDKLYADVASFPAGAASDTGVAGIQTDDGSRIVVVASSRTQIAEWPTGGGLRPLATVDVGGQLVGVLGEGSSAKILIADTHADVLEVLDTSLCSLQRIDPTPEATAAAAAQLAPYVGELPGGAEGGAEAYVYHGRLVTQEAGAGVVVSPAASLAGAEPLGLVGPDDGEIALVDNVGESPTATRRGGRLADLAASAPLRITVLTAASYFDADPARFVFKPFEGAATSVGEDGVPILLAGADGFTASFDAPPGSNARLLIQAGGAVVSDREFVVPDSGRLDISVPVSGLPADGEPARATLLVRTPGGRAHVAAVNLRLDLSAPEITTSAPLISLGPGVELTGVTDPGSTVSVEGREVAVADDGAFRAQVWAGLLPTDVRIEATDPAGNRRTVHSSVVGPIDYRMVPWPLVLVLLLVAVTARLYWRPPIAARRAGDKDRRADADGLEEIDR